MSQSNKPIDATLQDKRNEGYRLELVMGADTLLTIDLDHQHAIDRFEQRLKILNEQGVFARKLDEWTSKGGTGRHVMVLLDYPLNFQQRAVYQAFLGSDPTRELLGYFNVNNKGSEPFCLFKPLPKATGGKK
jgi:hypothetical protein